MELHRGCGWILLFIHAFAGDFRLTPSSVRRAAGTDQTPRSLGRGPVADDTLSLPK